MRYLRLFKESKEEDDILYVLSKPGWKKIDPPKYEHWLTQLEYKISDDIKIMLLKNKKANGLPYYLVKDESFYYISTYSSNHTLLYTNLPHYDSMIKICNYLLPFFEKKPDDEFIQNIRDCFISIEDFNNLNVNVKWGYCDIRNEEFGFFPAFRYSDILCLSFIYNHYGKINYDDVLDIIEEGIDRVVGIYNIQKDNVSLFNTDDSIIIRIKF